MISHVVLFQPKADLTIEAQRELAGAVRQACREAPTVQRFEIGRVVDAGAGYSGKFGGASYEFIAVIEFADRAGLMAYLNHPSHKKLAELFWRACESTTIIDAETLEEV